VGAAVGLINQKVFRVESSLATDGFWNAEEQFGQGTVHHLGGSSSFAHPLRLMKAIPVVFLSIFLLGATELLQGAPAAVGGQGSPVTQNIPSPTPYAVTKQDGNSRVWERTVYEPDPNGQAVPRKHHFTELATGLNYWSNGQWLASKEEIDLLPQGGAAATQGQHQAYFPGDIYQGQIEVVTPDGKTMQSRPLGIFYDDGTNTVFLAALTNSVGEIVGTNQVIYTNAFAGLTADVRYTYRKGGFEQDIVLRQQPPAPATFGLDPTKTRLQVLTEFFNTADPVQTSSEVNQQAGLSDTTLAFGQMQMVRGKAFSMGNTSRNRDAMVYKSWQHIAGRTFLVEELPVRTIATQLEQLPVPANAVNTVSAVNPVLHKASATRLLPPTRFVQAGTNAVRLARSDLNYKSGVVLDYVEVNTDQTNYTFQGDETYLIDGEFTLTGVTTFEGGTVIKYDVNGAMDIDSGGTINCLTSAYRPAIFTSLNDDSVGESMGDSPDPYYTGIPAYGDLLNVLNVYAADITLHDLRFSYCLTGINQFSGSMDVWNCQFNEVDTAASGYDIALHNVLIGRSSDSGIDGAVWVCGAGTSLIAEHVTADGGSFFADIDYSSSGVTVALTNCLVTGQGLMSGTATLSTNSTCWIASPTDPVYQTVCGGNYYLTNGSPYRNAGTTNIDPTLLADIAAKTTYPPVVCSNITFTNATNFSPQAQRDTDTPDLGYHYDPIDYAFGGCEASSNLTFTAGTAAGWFRTSSGWYHAGQGIHLDDQQTCTFSGTATAPCYWVRLNTVQEADLSAGYGPGGMTGWAGSVASAPTVSAQFLRCSMINNEGVVFRDDYGALIGRFTDCEFYSSGPGGYISSYYATNCLFERANLGMWDGWSGNAIYIINSTFHGGYIYFTPSIAGVPVTVLDSAFDDTTMYIGSYGANASYATYDYNAYTNSPDPFPVGGSHDVIVTNFNWQSNWFGNYYQTTNSLLIDKGSTTADQVGLYHFTTQTNQLKETNSIVDIGYHYVATDAYGNPVDTDGDGLPDYVEDVNGNGMVDPGETSWTNWDTDGDGVSDGQEIADGTDPLDPGSVIPLQLGCWRFNTTNWVGDEGQMPLNQYGLGSSLVSGIESNAVDIAGAYYTQALSYRYAETNGQINLTLKYGTVIFWFKPSWSGTGEGGTGPGSWARLIDFGEWTPDASYGLWMIFLQPSGDEISANVQDNTGDSGGTPWATIPGGMISNQWMQIAVTYTPTSTAVYVDGTLEAAGGGLNGIVPPAGILNGGFFIGSDTGGGQKALGTFDLLQTFNYALSATSIATNFESQMASYGLSSPPTISITSPASSTTNFVGTNLALNITVNAHAGPGTFIQEVEYYYQLFEGGYLPIGVSTVSPFSIAGTNSLWNYYSSGLVFSIMAVATDNTGVSATNVSDNVSIMLDTDGNGMPDWWQMQYFGHLGVDPSADPDDDGTNNLQEFRQGTDPMPALTIVGGNFQDGNYGSFLPAPVVIGVTNDSGVGLSNSPIVFTVSAGTILLAATPTNTPSSSLVLDTYSNGLASVWVYFPTSCSNPPDSTIVAFPASGTNSVGVSLNEYVTLGHWRFDNTNTWAGDGGQLPLMATNVTGVPSWSTNAVLIDSTSPAVLNLPTVWDPVAVSDASFETTNLGSADWSGYCSTFGPWTFVDWGWGGGVVCYPDIYELLGPPPPVVGSQLAFLQGYCQMSQTLTNFTVGQTYTVDFWASTRYYSTGNQTWDVLINGAVVAAYDPGYYSTLQHYTASFVAPSNTCVLTFQATDLHGGDNTVFIDNVSVYGIGQTNGAADINCQTGSVLFYFKPDWSSVDEGGTGPGTSGRLVETGNYNPAFTNGWWSLYLSPDGNNMMFATSTNGDGMTNLIGYFQMVSNRWYQIALTYSPTGSALFVDGQNIANGTGVTDLPNADEMASGFRIGSDQNGGNQAGGAFDELETFATPLAAFPTPVETYWFGIPDYKADPNGTLAAWQIRYFGHIGLDPNNDYDNDGVNDMQEFQNGTDPNKISFSASFPNQYVTTNIVGGVITILGGVPSDIAVLVDSTNFTGATWNPYSSNVTVNLGSTDGAHDVWIGIRGAASGAYQTWNETTLVLDSTAPTISITNPVDGVSMNAARINVSGNFSAASLKQITVNDILAFVNGTNFEAVNVPLAGGSNTITAVIEDLTGATNTASINVTGLTNSDGSMNEPVLLQASPVAGFAPLPVTFSVQTNFPGTIQQVSYDFNGDDIADFVTNNLDSITYTYATNGEYFPVVTIQTTAGRFSSIGGWNAVVLDPSNQPVQINVQPALTQTVFASITDPVDLKWIGTNLYVLSGSTAIITEFDTNADIIRSVTNIASSSGFDVDAAGNIYVAVTASNQVWKFFPTNSSFLADTNFGVGGFIGDTNGMSGSTNGVFNAPFDVAVSPDGGTISVSDSGNNRIQQFSASNGVFVATFGTNGSDIGQFNNPAGLTYDSAGTLYIVDSGNNRIALAQNSVVVGVSGTNGIALGQFSSPTNISIDERGVYVADAGNNRIQSFSPPVADNLFSIEPSTIRFAVSTNFSLPAAVAATDNLTNETLYVADTGNNRVLLYTLSPDDPTPTWMGMTNRLTAGDISGALSYFSVAAVDDYQQAFLSAGTVSTISAINQIGTLTPVYILDDQAEYYFQQVIAGQTITFPIEFDKENGVWKILEF
jgi:hypothetical protein